MLEDEFLGPIGAVSFMGVLADFGAIPGDQGAGVRGRHEKMFEMWRPLDFGAFILMPLEGVDRFS